MLSNNLESIAKSMSETLKNEKWSLVGFVCLAQTLISEFGTRKAERTLNKYAPHVSQKRKAQTERCLTGNLRNRVSVSFRSGRWRAPRAATHFR